MRTEQLMLGLVLVSGGTLAANEAALAVEYRGTAEQRMACTPDANNLCADEIPDREKVYTCLVKKVNELSPACKKIISASIGPAPRSKK